MMMGLILLIVVLLFLFGGGFGYYQVGYHQDYGWAPFGGLGFVVVVVLVVLLLSGRL